MTRPAVIPIAAAAAPAEASAPVAGGGLASLPPLSLYIHYPWCVRKCPYCDFNSHEARNDLPEAAYLDALIDDLERALPAIWGRRAVSVFIGGGTPSLLSAAGLERLLGAVRARLPLLADAEITLEANPGTVDVARFAAYRAAGINRLSLGIQSFNDQHLAALGRIHDGDQARLAIAAAQRHFENINLDLMYALPQQSLAAAAADIDTALGFGTTHLSAYHLTIEPNTAFHQTPPSVPDDELSADMQEMLEARLQAAGYRHYETSAFARPGWQCQHNLNYWSYGDYLGIGAGAHSKLSSAVAIWREVRLRHPKAYLAGQAQEYLQERQGVAASERAFEFMMNALRLTDGFQTGLFAAHTGLPLASVGEALRLAQRQGLLEMTADTIRPTFQGQRFLNDLLALFLPPAAT